jgi:DtxR family Mn-dependent transcriptional regulator
MLGKANISGGREDAVAAPRVLSESLGDYLESIYHLERSQPAARVKDIAERMKVQKSSVTGALRLLAEKDLVNYDPYSFVTLTPRGERVARDLVRRHETLRQFLTRVLAVEAAAADRNACHMEHAIEPQVLEKLVRFLRGLDGSHRGGGSWRLRLANEVGRGADAAERRRSIRLGGAAVAGKA